MTRRAIELVRVSGHDQHERDTAQAQRDALDALRLRRPAEVIARIDPPGAVSASLPVAQRPDLAELRRLAEQGFDELRCFDLTRLSRAESPVDRMMVLSLVASAGAIIVDCSGRELDPTRDEDELAYYVQTLFGRAERRKFVARSAAGKHARAAQGQIIARLGFGYRPVPRASKREAPTYEIDPVQGPLVAAIYQRALEGEGTRPIARWLESEGVPAPRGGRRWSASRVLDLIRSETYCGTFEQSVEGVTYKVECPAIVSRETWEAAQAVISDRCQTRGRPGTIQALCRMRAWCARCGSRITIRTQSAGRGYGPRYMCTSLRAQNRRPGEEPCGSPTRPVAEVDGLVWADLRRAIEDPSLLLEADDTSGEQRESWQAQVSQSEKALVKAKRDEKRVLDLLRRDLLSDESASEELRRIRAARQTAERSAELARQALTQATRRTSISEDAVEAFRPLLDTATFEERRRILEALIPEGREFGVFLGDDGTIEWVGVLVAGASEGSEGVGRSDLSACSNEKPLEYVPRITSVPTWAALWCAPQSAISRSGS